MKTPLHMEGMLIVDANNRALGMLKNSDDVREFEDVISLANSAAEIRTVLETLLRATDFNVPTSGNLGKAQHQAREILARARQ